MISTASVFGVLLGIMCSKGCTDKKEVENKEHTDSKALDTFKESVTAVSGQIDAAVVDAVNAVRIEQLLNKLAVIDRNKAGAECEIRSLKAEVEKLLLTHRGGPTGIHGFIGETSQVHIANIQSFVNGDEPLYILLDDNSMTDYVRGMQIIQQKACQAGGRLGLNAIRQHMVKYPEFVKNGGIYQIPKDMFERYVNLRNLPMDVAMKLRKEDLRLWEYIHNFTEEHPEIVIEPMEVSYKDIQAGNIDVTVKRIKKETDQKFQNQCSNARKEFAPSFKEFAKTCGISAAVEGGVSLGTELILKIRNGKKLSDFTKRDVMDVLNTFSLGCGRGALRGGIVYIGTNFLKLSTTVISGLVTVCFGLIREGYLYLTKQITKDNLFKNSAYVVVETVSSVGCAVIGRHFLKKHPLLGSIIGSILGSSGAGFIRRVSFA